MASAAIYDRWHLSQPHNDPGWEHPDPAQRLMPCKCGRGRNKMYPSGDHGCKARWQVRWKDETGKACKRSFKELEGDDPEKCAKAWQAKVKNDLDAGTYIDPAAGTILFRRYAEEVIEARTLDSGTRVKMRERMAKHVYPIIGDKPLKDLARRPSLVQAIIARMQKDGQSAGHIGVIMAHVGVVFSAALDDELI
ncbi:hypothetical protein, partial [Actinomadura sp. RB99]|uniref:hypothetical protein n=1 Tax=Actinomadura sp. RB99 TaxID=2691577 RepID=UPI0019D4F708